VDRFLQVPYTIYRDDPRWVAPLRGDVRQVLSPKNPFFDHAEARTIAIGVSVWTWDSTIVPT